MSDELWMLCGYVLLAAILLLECVCLWAGSSYYEAKAFNRVTGKNVSTWDAMWIELRVQEDATEQ